jgi:hypothetical protein
MQKRTYEEAVAIAARVLVLACRRIDAERESREVAA